MVLNQYEETQKQQGAEWYDHSAPFILLKIK